VLDIVNWLVDFELKAMKFYKKAGVYFADDEKLANLTKLLAEDEEWHARIIKEVSNHLKDKEPPPSMIRLDIVSRMEIDTLFNECDERFSSGNLSKKDFLDYIVRAEFSEWNTYLLYVVNVLKEISDEFVSVPMKMQEHKKRIEDYITELCEDEPDADLLLDKICNLPDVWKDKFLLAVDDEDLIVDLLQAILESKGAVDCAYNGKEALEKFVKKPYDLTITDVDMPVMDGIEFFKKACEMIPNAKGKFIFITGVVDDERLSFFTKHGLRYIQKPARIEEIINVVDDILQSKSKC